LQLIYLYILNYIWISFVVQVLLYSDVSISFYIFFELSPFSFTLESIINWSFERFELIHPSIFSSLFICIVFFGFSLCLHFPSLAFVFHQLHFLLYPFSCFISPFSFLFSVPTQYLRNNLNILHSLPWRQFFPFKTSFPLCFFLFDSLYCFIFLYTAAGINIQFGLFNLLNVFSVLNYTIRFALFSCFWSFESLRTFQVFDSFFSFDLFVLFNWIPHPSVCLTSWMFPPYWIILFVSRSLLVFDSASPFVLRSFFSSFHTPSYPFIFLFQLFILLLVLCLDQCVVFLSYNSRVCSYEFAS